MHKNIDVMSPIVLNSEIQIYSILKQTDSDFEIYQELLHGFSLLYLSNRDQTLRQVQKLKWYLLTYDQSFGTSGQFLNSYVTEWKNLCLYHVVVTPAAHQISLHQYLFSKAESPQFSQSTSLTLWVANRFNK